MQISIKIQNSKLLSKGSTCILAMQSCVHLEQLQKKTLEFTLKSFLNLSCERGCINIRHILHLKCFECDSDFSILNYEGNIK